MTELLSKLDSLYHLNKDVVVKPAHIQKTIKNEAEWTAGDVFNNLDYEVVSTRFVSNHGNLKIDQKRRFIRDTTRLIRAGYKYQDLVKMDENCINKNGTVDEENLLKLLDDMSKDHF